MTTMRKVSKDEFYAFVKSYPKTLFHGIGPHGIYYADHSLGADPVIARNTEDQGDPALYYVRADPQEPVDQ